MFLELSNEQYDNIVSSLRYADFDVISVPVRSSDFTSADNCISANISLPDSSKSLSDYSSALIWTYANNYFSAIPISFKMSSSFGSDNPQINSSLTVFSIEDNGNGSALLSIYNSDENSPLDYSDFISTVHSVMFISSEYYHPLTINNSLIFNSISDALSFFEFSYHYSSYNVLDDKEFLITLDYDDSLNTYMPHVYRIHSREPEVTLDDTLYFNNSSYYYRYGRFCANCTSVLVYSASDILLHGIDPEDEENETDANKLSYAVNNTLYLNSFFSEHSIDDILTLDLSEGKVYYFNTGIILGSNIKIVGNNASFKIFNTEIELEGDRAGKPKRIDLFCIDFSERTESNIKIFNLNLIGRNEAGNQYKDQCFHYYRKLLYKNLTLDNVTISNFSYGIHLSYGDRFVDENDNPIFINWVIKNSKIIKCGQNNMLSSVNGMKYTNCYIDNSLGKDAYEHAFYLGVRCSYITIEKCLIENSRGYGIKQDSQSSLQFDEYSHDNVFRDITIHNCYRGIWIGCISKNILVENVFAYGVLRGIVLESCIDVNVNNFNATSTEINRIVSRYGDNIELYSKGSADYAMIELKGKVKARFNNCYFKTDFIMFSHNNYKSDADWNCDVVLSTKDTADEQSGTELYFVKEKHGKNKPDSWVDDNYAFLTDVKFFNCTFDSKYTQNKLGMDLSAKYTQSNTDVTTVETVTKPGSTETKFVRVTNYNVMYQSNYAFNNCNFYFWVKCTEGFDKYNVWINNTPPALVPRGNTVAKSNYKFGNCNFAYYVTNKDELTLGLNNRYLISNYNSYNRNDNDISGRYTVEVSKCIIATNYEQNSEKGLSNSYLVDDATDLDYLNIVP